MIIKDLSQKASTDVLTVALGTHGTHQKRIILLTHKFNDATQVCEDIPQVLDSDVPGLPERPINIFLPRMLKVN